MTGRNRERGAVMVWALIFVIVTAGMIVSHSAYMASHRQTMDVQLKRKPLASNFARAGLTDALAWFQSQAAQPVPNFAPIKDTTVSPPVIDSEEPALGLVRSFEIRGNLWGRYEIRNSEAMDVSAKFGSATAGSVWELASRGYIYRVLDPNVPYDQAPNRVVSTARVETTIRTMPLNLPAAAAVSMDNPGLLTMGLGAIIRGAPGMPGVAGPMLDPIPAVPPTALGTPALLSMATFKPLPTDVFKMPLPQLRDMSDAAVSANLRTWLSGRQKQEQSVIYHDGDLTVVPGAILAGSMLLVVDGNFTVQAGATVDLEGVVYVTGATNISGPFLLRGALVARGALVMMGNGAGQDAVIEYDSAVVTRLTGALNRYRASRMLREQEKTSSEASTAPTLGAGTSIDNSAATESGVQIGSGTTIEARVKIGANTQIGDSGRVRAQTSIGSDVLIGDNVQIGQHVQIDSMVTIEDNVTIGQKVVIGAGARIRAGTVVADDTVIRAGEIVPDGTLVIFK